MKVIIIKKIDKYKENQIVEVSDGYGKNFLIKNGYAQPVNKQTMANLERIKTKIEDNEKEMIAKANEVKVEIENLIFNFSLKSNGNIVHGSVTNTAIEKELQKNNIKIPKNAIDKIFLTSFGTHYVPIKLHPNVIAKLRLIISEEK